LTGELADLLSNTPSSDESAPESARVRLIDRINPGVCQPSDSTGLRPPGGRLLLASPSLQRQRHRRRPVGRRQCHRTLLHPSLRLEFALGPQHNENRIFFPNLIVILLSRTTHFNVQVEEYLTPSCWLWPPLSSSGRTSGGRRGPRGSTTAP